MYRQSLNQDLIFAVVSKDLEKVKDCLDKGADSSIGWYGGSTSLHFAAQNGYPDIVRLLLEREDIDPNKENRSGDTPLHSAARRGHPDIVQLLLERTDINPEKKNKHGNTPFDIAAENNQFQMIKLLLGRTNIDAKRLYRDGDTVLHKAARSGDLETLQYLLEISNIDPNQTNKDGDNLLHVAVDCINIKLVKMLLERTKIDPAEKNKTGNTLLHLAVGRKNIELVKFLLAKTKIDSAEKNEDGDNLLHVAVDCINIKLVKLLLERTKINPAEKNKNGNTILHSAVRRKNIELVELLLARTKTDSAGKNENGDTLLHLAVLGKNIELVQLILERTEIDPAEKNKDGDNLLHIAVDCNNIELVKLLLKRTKINPAEKNKNGNTLLHSAVRRKNIELVKLLLSRTKIDPAEKNENGDTLLHLAVLGKNIELVQLILERTEIDPAEKNKANKTSRDAICEREWYSEKKKEDIRAIRRLLTSYETKDRSVPKNPPTVIQKEDAFQETFANDGVNSDPLLPFAGTSEEFNKLLSTGTYESFENRVFLCGSCACGKSTLASVLIGSPIPLTWKSTDGLVIHFGRNGINLETFEMVPLQGEERDQNVLTKVVIGRPTRATRTSESPDTRFALNIDPSPIETGNLESKEHAIKKDASYSFKVSQSSEAYSTDSQDLPITNTFTSEIKKTSSIRIPKMKKIEAYAVRDDILKEVKSGRYKIKIAPSDLVDFGGQRSYDMTHQLFVQHGGTFVVMFDGSRDFYKPLKEYPTGDISNEFLISQHRIVRFGGMHLKRKEIHLK